MINDVTAVAFCDGCGALVGIRPAYVPARGGCEGYWDMSDSAITWLLGGEGWAVVDDPHFEAGKILCPRCQDRRKP